MTELAKPIGWLTRARSSGALPLLVGLGALVVFYQSVNPHDPVAGWLVWRYLAIISLAGIWAASALSGGFFLSSLIGLKHVSFRERLVVSFALGVLAWGLLIVAVGLIGVLGRVTFFAIPLLMFGVGGIPLVRALKRAARLRRRLPATRVSLFARVCTAFGLISVALIYANILTPRNVMYDARWYHLPLAEQYAAAGRVFRLDEGWFNGTMPHFASYLYTWAFCSPFGHLFDRVELAAHLEFVLFVATLVSVPVLVDRLRPRPRLASAWVARFLFPGVMLYDSTLGCGADHVLAFLSVPLFLALLRLWSRPSHAHGELLGEFSCAALATK